MVHTVDISLSLDELYRQFINNLRGQDVSVVTLPRHTDNAKVFNIFAEILKDGSN